MPNRIMRDWTFSTEMSNVSFGAEVFITRLMQRADDYGCFYGDPEILISQLFPKKGCREISTNDIDGWIQESVNQELIVYYNVGLKWYIQIIDFDQRVRAKKPKFPLPPHKKEVEEIRVLEPVEFESKPNDTLEFRKLKFGKELEKYLETYGREMLKEFHNHWTELNRSGKKMRFELQTTWELSKRLVTWKNNAKKFAKNGNSELKQNTNRNSRSVQSQRKDFDDD